MAFRYVQNAEVDCSSSDGAGGRGPTSSLEINDRRCLQGIESRPFPFIRTTSETNLFIAPWSFRSLDQSIEGLLLRPFYSARSLVTKHFRCGGRGPELITLLTKDTPNLCIHVQIGCTPTFKAAYKHGQAHCHFISLLVFSPSHGLLQHCSR